MPSEQLFAARSHYAETIEALRKNSPDFALSLVPAAATRFWAIALGSPGLATKNTSYGSAKELPPSIPLVEDLQILTNLIENAGEEKLLRMLIELQHSHGDSRIINAPNLAAALDLRVRGLNVVNPHFSIELSRSHERAILTLKFDKRLDSFLPFLELAAISYLVRPIRRFLSLDPNFDRTLSDLHHQSRHLPPHYINVARELLCCTISTRGKRSELKFPSAWLSVENPEHDPIDWARNVQMLKRKERLLSQRRALSHETLQDFVYQYLRQNRKPPQLPDAASAFGVSARTFSRKLSRRSLSVRNTVLLVRQEMAEELLANLDFSVSEVAAELGYSAPSSFIRTFHKWHGVSPDQWRKTPSLH